LFSLSTRWLPNVFLLGHDMCVSIHDFTELFDKIILPCFGYQLHSCIFYVGLTYLMMRMEASPHSWISFCFNFFFGRCIMFLSWMQRCGFGLSDLNLAQLKSSSFSVSMVSFVTFQSVPFFKGINEKLGKTYMYPCWKFMLEYRIFLFQAFEHFDIVIWLCMLLKMSLKFYFCWCPKFSSINLCLLKDVSNALQQWISLHV
jgi:hypothetical protein